MISDNTGHGVLIDSFDLANTDGNWLTGNTISDNGLSGVRIDDADDNSVGLPDRKVNTITGNAQDGVAVDSGQGNAVANNSIYGNDDLGIDLDDDGPTANDGLGDPDPGPNGLQNHPTITGHVARFQWPCRVPVRGLRRRSAGRCAAICERLPARVLPQRHLRRPWRGRGAPRHATGDDRRQRSRGGHGPALAAAEEKVIGDCDAD